MYIKNEYGRTVVVKIIYIYSLWKECMMYWVSNNQNVLRLMGVGKLSLLGSENQGFTEVTVELGHQGWVGFLQIREANALQGAGSLV